jgi:choline dehydrogenase-like flavoprotein
MLTTEEKRLSVYIKVYLVINLLLTLFSIVTLFLFPEGFKVFLAGFSVLNVLLSWLVIADIRRFILLAKIMAAASAGMVIITAVLLLAGHDTLVYFFEGMSLPFSFCLAALLSLNLINAVLSFIFIASSEKARYRLKYFSPLQYKTLSALAEVIIFGDEEIIPHDDVASNVDTYFNSFEARSKWTMAMVITLLYFYPLLSLHPPLPFLSAEKRLSFLKKRFYSDIEGRRMPEFWRELAQGMIRIAKQMCYIGYYNDPRTFDSVGYVPFSKRKDAAERVKQTPQFRKTPPLKVLTEKDINNGTIESDVVIAGSGAAASILAKGLAEAGRKVLLVERGYYEVPETYTENEMEMVSRLYHDGAIQAARDFRFTVFQGSCVGGSTVLNNAVCFKMPSSVLNRWNDPAGLNAGLDKKGVMESMDRVWDLMGVKYMDEKIIRLNPGGYLFSEGCKKLGYASAPNVTDSVSANISNCVGCGYCNIGCTYNRKLSMILTVLPDAQQKAGADRFRILAGCEIVKLQRKGNRIDYAEGEFFNRRKVKIKGKTFILSAGAISSSIILLKSKLGVKNVGEKLSFNIGSQLTAAFPHKVDSYDGLQISHYMKNSPDTGFVMESWYNPPMFQSTAMPGWFENHFNNMRRYDRLACVGILAGSESNARIRTAGLTGREIEYTPTKKDFRTLLSGIELAGEIMLAAGAESVMPNTFRYHEFKSVEELRRLKDLVNDSSEITLGTGHPQGGNVIASSPDKGVVNPEFKVFGYDNLFVCDASVFPSSVGINPQLTVMGLADYAVQFIKNN